AEVLLRPTGSSSSFALSPIHRLHATPGSGLVGCWDVAYVVEVRLEQDEIRLVDDALIAIEVRRGIDGAELVHRDRDVRAIHVQRAVLIRRGNGPSCEHDSIGYHPDLRAWRCNASGLDCERDVARHVGDSLNQTTRDWEAETNGWSGAELDGHGRTY